jgi:hypothetical protein
MTSMTVKYTAITVVLAGALGLTAADSSAGHIRAGAETRGVVAQFCLPPPDGSDAHRFHCRWPG